MTETIKWNDKEYKMPFDADYNRQKADSFKEQVIITNRFSNEPALLPWFAVAVYDVIMGTQFMATAYDEKHGWGTSPEWNTVRKGLDWFRKYFAKEYMVLLD